jgi:hypothetical protein
VCEITEASYSEADCNLRVIYKPKRAAVRKLGWTNRNSSLACLENRNVFGNMVEFIFYFKILVFLIVFFMVLMYDIKNKNFKKYYFN